MLFLKDYQSHALDALSLYFRACVQEDDADVAFYRVTEKTLGRHVPYQKVEPLPGLPYVCLRMPTGGGKTLVACHAVGRALQDLLQADRCVVLWLVPSNAILEQTLKALKDRSHPYHQAVQSAVGEVRVLDVREALYVNRATLDTATTIIVSTMQAFRVQDTEGRKVYETNGPLGDHFSGLDEAALRDLERHEGGPVRHSLANVLRLRRPIVIVDEAHNARTDLSFDVLARFNPACIVELTATPDTKAHPSNVLFTVSAAALKAEEMIKLPIQLTTFTPWKDLLNRAIAQRNHLERIAAEERKATGEYLRPIMLLQAEARRGSNPITVDVVEACLKDDFRIPDDQIARATGADDDLSGVDLLDAACPIRYVITVQKLREGWDCPFAYVLCSVAALRSSVAVEQIVGRVLRMPYAQRKHYEELNQAYAFSASGDFATALNAVKDVLVENGFERQEVETMVRQAARHREERRPGPAPLFDQPPPEVRVTIQFTEPPKLDALPQDVRGRVNFEARTGTLTYRGTMNEAERDALRTVVSKPENQEAIDRAYNQIHTKVWGRVKTAVEQGQPFDVPLLAIRQGEFFERFEETHLIEYPWSLADCEPTLPTYTGPRVRGQGGIIDVTEEGSIQTRFVSDLQRQMILLEEDQGWTVGELVRWLDRSIPHQDILPHEARAFLTQLIEHLTTEGGFTLHQLVHDKFDLRKAVDRRIEEHRRQTRKTAHQALLFSETETPVSVRPDVVFSYPKDYVYQSLYQGRHVFGKHYYPRVGSMNSEEEQCAQFIDQLPEVAYWVRNPERQPRHAFWLQTSTDRFYPDFVCKLRDGRYLTIEYKGEDRWSNEDSTEKRSVGDVWEKRSEGRCLFVMPKGLDFEVIRARLT